MKPITRIEQLLSGVELTPITRLETYIASLNGQNVITPSPVTREEQILLGTELKPITRLEMFMMYGMGMLDSVPEPITREEWFWKNWGDGEPKEYEVYVSGIVPLELKYSLGKNLVDWSIVGNTYQASQPSPSSPVSVLGVGDYDTSTGMYKVPVVSRGKNLFDISQITGGGVANSTESIGTNYGYVSNKKYYSNYGVYGQGTILKGLYFDLKSGDQITISTDVLISENDLNSNEAIYVGIRKFNGSKNQQTVAGIAYHGEKIRLTKTLVVNDSGKYALSLSASGTSTQFTNLNTEFSNIQLELCSIATEYEPYRQPIATTQYLPTPLMANERLTPTAREVKWGVKVFDGSENWVVYGSAFYTHLDNPVKRSYPLCSHISIIYIDDSAGSNTRFLWSEIGFNILEEWKSFLKSEYDAGHPVTVWYQLANPTTEPVTTTPIGTLDGECWIDVDTEIEPVSMSATYKSSKPDNDMQSLMELFKEV